MTMKRVLSLALAVLMLCSILCGCNPDTPESANANYKVTVIGADGKPMTTGVVVKFMQNGVQQAMQTVDAGGLASKELPKGDYTVELMFTVSGVSYGYDKAACVLSAEKTELTIELLNSVSGEPQVWNVKIDENTNRDYEMYNLGDGRTSVPLTEGDRTFYIFTPTKAGIYEVSFTGNIESIGYYGAPYFINNINVGKPVEGKENTFQLEVLPDMLGEGETGTAQYVIGIDGAAGTTQGILNILWVAEIPAEIPYTTYERTHELTVFKMPENAKIGEFDLSKKYNLVLDEATGFYHLDSVDGPLVLVRIGTFADSSCKYILSSFHTVMQGEGLVRWYYNDKGEVEKKLGFNQCMLEYLDGETVDRGKVVSYTYVDNKTGLYPLTEDLRFIITEVGIHKGWFDSESMNFLFTDDMGNKMVVDPETAWLFNCCYIEN